MVWDVRNSKCLLECSTGTGFDPRMSFSSDGLDVYIWKESPAGYTLREILQSSIGYPSPLLSRNGESIVALSGPTIRLWRTKGFTTPPSSFSIQSPEHTDEFLLDFSPDGTLAAVTMRKEKTVTVLNLESGVPQLVIDASIGVYGLRVIRNAITVIGGQKVITWNLPTGDRVSDAKVTLEDSARTMNLRGSTDGYVTGASISPDSCRVALVTEDIDRVVPAHYLYIYDGSTGEQLAQQMVSDPLPFFAPDGRELWIVDKSSCGEVLMVDGGGQVLRDPGRRVDVGHPPEGYPWASSRGYQVTSDWWILGPDGKRLLMLPPLWQSPLEADRVWKGKFLALLHRGRSEPVILEL